MSPGPPASTTRHDHLRRRGGAGRTVPAKTSGTRWPRRGCGFADVVRGALSACRTARTSSPAGRCCAAVSARSGRPPPAGVAASPTPRMNRDRGLRPPPHRGLSRAQGSAGRPRRRTTEQAATDPGRRPRPPSPAAGSDGRAPAGHRAPPSPGRAGHRVAAPEDPGLARQQLEGRPRPGPRTRPGPARTGAPPAVQPRKRAPRPGHADDQQASSGDAAIEHSTGPAATPDHGVVRSWHPPEARPPPGRSWPGSSRRARVDRPRLGP